MEQGTSRITLGEKVVTGAILAVLIAVTSHALGVQQLLRIPYAALYLPAAVLGAVIGATRLRPLLWIASAPLALCALLIAYTPLVFAVGRRMVRADPIPARVDAIAVLGRGVTPEGMMRGETLNRLVAGIALARRVSAPVLFVSRERTSFKGRTVSDSADLAAFVGMIPHASEVVFVDSVLTTRTEALQMRGLGRARGISTVAVVTSPLHTRRACATFESVGFRVVCVPAPARESGLGRDSSPADRLGAFRSWLYEIFATASYRSRGWIR